MTDPVTDPDDDGGLFGSIVAGVTSTYYAGIRSYTFGDWAYQQIRRPVFKAEWDAWGHCVIAAITSYYGSAPLAHLFGELYETGGDLSVRVGREHDSGPQDRHNQAVGRSIADELCHEPTTAVDYDYIDRRCRQAYLEGRLLIGPSRGAAYTRSLNFYLFPVHQDGRRWLPLLPRGVAIGEAPQDGVPVLTLELRPEPEFWVEVIEPGERGTARGPTQRPARPIDPLPTGYDIEHAIYLYRDEPSARIRERLQSDAETLARIRSF